MSDSRKLTINLLSVTILIVQRQLIHERTINQNIDKINFDFIIVGAGTAGSTVAHRLSENQTIDVLLLEAGAAPSALFTDPPAMADLVGYFRPDLHWNYSDEPQQNASQLFPFALFGQDMAKMIGGSSSHNTMMYNRGNKRDFDYWDKHFGATDWDYDNILRYFKRSEKNNDMRIVGNNPNYHGTNGLMEVSTNEDPPKFFQALAQACEELGFNETDINGPQQLGYCTYQQTITSAGLRASNSNAFIDPNPHPLNLYISANSFVTKILFNNNIAIGVEFTKNSKTLQVFAKKEIIITAGAYNTPKLLMLSGIGIESHLKKFNIPVKSNLPVGNHYKMHPATSIFTRFIDFENAVPLPILNMETLSLLYVNKTGVLSKYPIFGLYFNTDGNQLEEWPNGMMHVTSRANIVIFAILLVRIQSEGTIRLRSINPLTPPKIDPNHLADPVDFEDMKKALSFVLRFIETTSFASKVKKISFNMLGCPGCDGQPSYECNEGIECLVRHFTISSDHPCCSCRMGDVNRDDVVVDPYLKVKGINSLRVCDASVFPDITNSNPNAPTTMVAEKCSSMIKKKYKL